MPEASLHVTLVFLGATDPAEVARIWAAVPAGGPRRRVLAGSELVALPAAPAARVRAGPGGPRRARHRAAAWRRRRGLGEDEGRPWLPHVTLARVRKGHRATHLATDRRRSSRSRRRRVSLLRSHPGSRYEVLERVRARRPGRHDPGPAPAPASPSRSPRALVGPRAPRRGAGRVHADRCRGRAPPVPRAPAGGRRRGRRAALARAGRRHRHRAARGHPLQRLGPGRVRRGRAAAGRLHVVRRRRAGAGAGRRGGGGAGPGLPPAGLRRLGAALDRLRRRPAGRRAAGAAGRRWRSPTPPTCAAWRPPAWT